MERNGTASEGANVYAVIPWSDDFKLTENRRSVWAMTVTICPPPGSFTSPMYTFPIALGNKCSDHEPIITRFFAEISELRKVKMMYHSPKDRVTFL